MTETRTQVLAIIAAQDNEHTALESLDAVFASAVFDIGLSVLFMGDAIHTHLLANDSAESGKQLHKQWAASDLYDIEALWVLAEDAQGLKLKQGHLPSNVKVIDKLPEPSHFKHVLSL